MPLFVGQVDNVKKVSNPLRSVHIKDKAVFSITERGIRVVLEEYSSFQAITFLQAEIFDTYEVSKSFEFGISLNTLLECLNIFGTSGSIISAPALKVSYEGYGSPLVILLSEHGICTDCSIRTIDADFITDFDFCTEGIINKIILKAEAMRATLGDLDSSSDIIEIKMSPELPQFRLSTYGAAGIYHIDYSKYSEAVESCQNTQTRVQRYKFSFINATLKALHVASKVSFRMNRRGFLSIHFLLENDGKFSFVEFLCCPEDIENTADSDPASN
ncbi:cell cycle checkpoint protein RAD1-like [Zophobas morio]|uniref:cell cycle checkpoint protein RAD1-like n=1 Tax=Zophobas morio TaxID=2755281 RepID=UPI003083308E